MSIRSCCKVLPRHPDLRFTRGEAWSYQIVERPDPGLFERIRAHARVRMAPRQFQTLAVERFRGTEWRTYAGESLVELVLHVHLDWTRGMPAG